MELVSNVRENNYQLIATTESDYTIAWIDNSTQQLTIKEASIDYPNINEAITIESSNRYFNFDLLLTDDNQAQLIWHDGASNATIYTQNFKTNSTSTATNIKTLDYKPWGIVGKTLTNGTTAIATSKSDGDIIIINNETNAINHSIHINDDSSMGTIFQIL